MGREEEGDVEVEEGAEREEEGDKEREEEVVA